jgi:UDPglucose 6-dehydrogenase
VIGLGKLGAPMLAVFAKKGFGVIGMDLDPNVVKAINEGLAPVREPQLQELISANRERLRATLDMREAVLNSDVTFIIVPTPSGKDSFFRNDYVVSALQGIGRALRDKAGYHNVVVTSTVMPGSTGTVLKAALEESSGRKVGQQLGLCYNPEFIALGSVVRDMLYPDLILIGESDRKAGDLLASIYSRSTESNPEVHRMNWVNAELCKIAVNTYITTKISYANMIAEMCDHLPGADSDVITSALGADSRIGKKYIKGAVGYGGPCFPRDNKAFAALGRRLGVRTELAEATEIINDHQSKRLFEAIKLSAAPGAKVAILGLSYKPNTAVIEESQGLILAHMLSEAGYRVALSDPEAMTSLPAELPDGVERAESADAAMVGAAVVAIVTPWAAYRSLTLPSEGLHSVVDPWRMIDPTLVGPDVKLIRLGAGDWLAHDDSNVRALRGLR